MTQKLTNYQKVVLHMDANKKELKNIKGWDAIINYRIELRNKGISITENDLIELLSYRYQINWR